ncbi:hypothetical protein E2005C_044 [Pseudomonas phage E2005-C]|uniref:Uncharacterized protein n=1 Tax=Pseudomonas phage vB_PaeM_PE1 TaxID=3161145 RepID=A0AAU8EH95_9CAUD|nr:hypothetical protein E2005C_044 [Pseudomonas phage E2005-C]
MYYDLITSFLSRENPVIWSRKLDGICLSLLPRDFQLLN